MAAPRIEVHGHRGARTVLPENTVPGFEYAIREGADFLELDLNVTKDNVLVVAHDPVMNEKICKGPEGAERTIRKMTLAELRRWDCGSKGNADFPHQKPLPKVGAPTFDEVLDLVSKGKSNFNVEIKSYPAKPELVPEPAEYARMVLDAIRKHKVEDRVLVQSFDFRPLREMKKLAPEMPLSALYPSSREDSQRDFVDIAQDAGTKAVSIHLALITPEKVERAHKAGLRVLAWTANTEAEWDKLVAAKVDGIITDDPAGVIAYLKKKGLR